MTSLQEEENPKKKALRRIMNQIADNLTLSSKIPYNQIDHSHCWSKEKPPCGQKIEHFKCCLCEKLNPKIEKARQEWREGLRGDLIALIPERKKYKGGEYKDRRAGGFNECRNIILKALTGK